MLKLRKYDFGNKRVLSISTLNGLTVYVEDEFALSTIRTTTTSMFIIFFEQLHYNARDNNYYNDNYNDNHDDIS